MYINRAFLWLFGAPGYDILGCLRGGVEHFDSLGFNGLYDIGVKSLTCWRVQESAQYVWPNFKVVLRLEGYCSYVDLEPIQERPTETNRDYWGLSVISSCHGPIRPCCSG